MPYTVLARKYRSRTFSEVIGQEPIATTLVNAIRTGRIHHGYLFTGTRGVGKTSMARILAKALNCQKFDAPTATPCCVCDICQAVAEGQDVDVIEIDAASNTSVDDIRALRSNTAYMPARARFKVYIIDEVHMLSNSAFNALLKTLEEPPDHVKFILATTELQKVPATIRSRCQNFNFRNIGPAPIAKRLREICAEEGATVEEAVVQRVARLASGSMRDALSILDQLLSVSPTRLDATLLDELLPPAQNEQVFGLLQQAAAGDVPAVLIALDALLSGGRGLDVFCSDAIEVVRTLMLIRACGVDAAVVDVPAGAQAEYAALAQQFELSHYVQMIAMLEELRRHARFSGAGRALTEAVLVRFAKLREWTAIEDLLRQVGGGAAAAGAGPTGGSRVAVAAPPPRGDEKKKPASALRPPAGEHADAGLADTRPMDVVKQRRVAALEVPPAPPTVTDGVACDVPQGEALPEEVLMAASATVLVEAQATADAADAVSASAARAVTADIPSVNAAPGWRDAPPEVMEKARRDPLVVAAQDLLNGALLRVQVR